MSSNKITLAQLSWSNEGVPISTEFDDVYFSTDDGLAEVEHNFISSNKLHERFMDMTKTDFRIAETGFGSGLNFLRAAELWLEKPTQGQLHFISFEKYPLSKDDLCRAHQTLPKKRSLLMDLAQQLQSQYPYLTAGWHDIYFADNRVRLTLWLGDVLKGLPELDDSPGSRVDAWFLDGFAPVKNPQMWQPLLYQQMARLSHAETTFATFTAAGEVRRGLEKAGFAVIKKEGFGLKREVCFGHLDQSRPFSSKTPWYVRPAPLLNGQAGHVIVIGAGLAGAAVAHKLAEIGWQVQVLEAEEQIASQASGNLAGTVHPLITADWNLRSQWYLQGFEATLRMLLPWLQENSQMGELNGLLELAMDEKIYERQSMALARVGVPRELAYAVDAGQASQLLGTDVEQKALFFPQGGWVYPKALIDRCLQHENIEVLLQHQVTKLIQDVNTKCWKLEAQTPSAVRTFEVDAVVVATGSLAADLNKDLHLPIRPVKGQVTHLNANQVTQPLQVAVTHGGYSVSHATGAVTGATFEAPDMNESISLKSHQENLDMTQKALPDWIQASAEEVTGRVAFRPTTPDHLPIIGAVPQAAWQQEAYFNQSHTHAVYRYPAQRYQQGLFVSNGHGPRGLMSVFLAAEVIAADIRGDALPQPLSLYHASHPARFQIRRWRSGK